MHDSCFYGTKYSCTKKGNTFCLTAVHRFLLQHFLFPFFFLLVFYNYFNQYFFALFFMYSWILVLFHACKLQCFLVPFFLSHRVYRCHLICIKHDTSSPIFFIERPSVWAPLVYTLKMTRASYKKRVQVFIHLISFMLQSFASWSFLHLLRCSFLTFFKLLFFDDVRF